MEINKQQKQKERLEKKIKEIGTNNTPPAEEDEFEPVEDKETLQDELDQLNFDLRMSNLQAGQIKKELEAFDEEESSPIVVSESSGIVLSINQDLVEGAPPGEQGGGGPLMAIVSDGPT